MRSPEWMMPSGNQPPSQYDRAVEFAEIVRNKDVAVDMRDGIRLAQTYFQKIKGPRKLTLNRPAQLGRPIRALIRRAYFEQGRPIKEKWAI